MKVQAGKPPFKGPYWAGHSQHESIRFPEEVHSVTWANTQPISQLLRDDDLTFRPDGHSHTGSLTRVTNGTAPHQSELGVSMAATLPSKCDCSDPQSMMASGRPSRSATRPAARSRSAVRRTASQATC